MTSPTDIMAYAYKGEFFTKSGIRETLVREGISPLKVHDLPQLLQGLYDVYLETMGGEDVSGALYDPQHLPQPIYRYAYEAISAQGITPHFKTKADVQEAYKALHALAIAQAGHYYFGPQPARS